MKLIRGRKIAGTILADLKLKIEKQKLKPRLAVVLIGENKASKLYIKLKARAAKKVGIKLILHKFKSGAREKDIIKLIKSLNKDKKISGIIVQLPLPEKFKTEKIIKSINPKKDADGFHPKNIKNFLAGKKGIAPVFPTAIIKLLNAIETHCNASLRGKRAIVLTNSEIFGKVMKIALKNKKIQAEYVLAKDLFPLIRPSGTFSRREKGIADKIKNADIVITAVGKPKIIKSSMIKRGAIVIDGGITKKGKKVFGDIDFNSVAPAAGYLSPVPGGVGPVTVACLLENVYRLSH